MAVIKLGSIVTDLSGSAGGSTIQKCRSGYILRNKPQQTFSRTSSQSLIRSINKTMQSGWRSLSDQHRKVWNDYAINKPVFNHSVDKHILSGHSLWLKYQFSWLIVGGCFMPSPYFYDHQFITETILFLSRFPIFPPLSVSVLINNLINSYVDCGYWSLSDVICKFNVFDSLSGLLNMKGSAYPCTPVSNPTFTKQHGYQGNGISAYMHTNYHRVLPGIFFTQNNAHFYSNIETLATIPANGAGGDGGGTGTAGITVSSCLNPLMVSYTRINQYDPAGPSALAPVVGHNFNSRANSTQLEQYLNGLKNVVTVNSFAMGNTYMLIFAINWSAPSYFHNAKSHGFSFGAYLPDSTKDAVIAANTLFNSEILSLSF